MDPVKFVRDRALWGEFEPLAPKPVPEKTFVEAGSRALAAWAVHNEIASSGSPPLCMVDGPGGRRGAWLPDALPPGGETLADFADELGRPDLAHWRDIEHGGKNWWAWSERVRRWTGQPLEADIIRIEGEGEMRMVNGREIFMPHKISGRRLPGEWPPRVPKAGADGEADQAVEAQCPAP